MYLSMNSCLELWKLHVVQIKLVLEGTSKISLTSKVVQPIQVMCFSAELHTQFRATGESFS